MSAYEEGPRTGVAARGDDLKDRAIDAVAEVDAGAMHVAGVAGEEVGSVAHDVKNAARGFFDETRTQLSEQASTQQRRAAGALRSTGDELEGLASGSSTGAGGMATSAVRTIGRQTRRAADWLEQREPADVVREVRGYARRHTGVFLAIAVGVGVVAGRITRALVSDARSGTGTTGATNGSRPELATGATAAGGTTARNAPTAGGSGLGTSPLEGDTPIADALASDSSAGEPTWNPDDTDPANTRGPSSTQDTAQDEWSASGEARR